MGVRRSRALVLAMAFVLAALAACGKPTTPKQSAALTLHLGHFPNLTHAPAIYGLEKGIFAKALGSDVKIDVKTFNAGPEAVQAIFSGDLDITYVGPNPSINAFQKSNGTAVRIIAGATSGGAALVTKPSIPSIGQLRGKTIATPQLGNTQDVALRAYLHERGLNTKTDGTGDVHIRPQDNSQTLDTFKAGQIDGAWVPEPYVSRLVTESGGHILVDEKTLWQDGQYDTTVVLVRKAFLDQHADVVKKFLHGHVEAIEKMNADAADAQTTVNKAIEKISGKPLKSAALRSAWGRLTFTWDPLISALKRSATSAKNVGLLKTDNITGIEDLTLLNQVLETAGKTKV